MVGPLFGREHLQISFEIFRHIKRFGVVDGQVGRFFMVSVARIEFFDGTVWGKNQGVRKSQHDIISVGDMDRAAFIERICGISSHEKEGFREMHAGHEGWKNIVLAGGGVDGLRRGARFVDEERDFKFSRFGIKIIFGTVGGMV